MRSFLIVAALVLVGLAAAASLFVRVDAQEPRATLDYSCDTTRVPSGVDTLLRCRAVARNQSSDVLEDVWFGFGGAGNVPPPDRYYFFAARLDGRVQEPSPGDITYSLGDIAPGVERVLELDVIVRVTQPSGALARLYAGDGTATAYDEEAVVIEPDDAAPDVTIRMDLSQPSGDPRRSYALLTVKDSGRATDTFTADLDLAEHMSVPAAYERKVPFLGQEVFGEKFHLTTVLSDPAVAAGVEQSIAFELALDEACQGGTIGVVGYVHSPDGTVQRPALLVDLPTDDSCIGGTNGDVTTLARGGFGPSGDAYGIGDLAAALLLLGVSLLAAAAGVRARRRAGANVPER